MIGIIFGLIAISVGFDTVSSRYPFTKSILAFKSIIAVSILVSSANSNIINDKLSEEIELIFDRFSVVLTEDSKIRVRLVSTFSALAPG